MNRINLFSSLSVICIHRYSFLPFISNSCHKRKGIVKISLSAFRLFTESKLHMTKILLLLRGKMLRPF